jgi:wyosine [tRNA(Phe)-imidazoG37] synthetase (radical SAM superfamily)
MEDNKLVLKGTTSYFESLDPEVSKRMDEGGLAFLNMPLPIGCNYKCPKCFSGGSDIYNEQLRQRGISTELEPTLRKDLIRNAFDLGARTLVIAGAGEPLLYGGLDDILELTGNLGMNSVVFTNGSQLSKERAQSLFSRGTSIVFTYDSTCSKHYDMVTGTRGNHDFIRANLEGALSLSENYTSIRSGHKILQFAINTNPTVFTFNQAEGIDEIDEISNLISGRAVHFVSHITPTGSAETNWELLTGKKDLVLNPQLKEAEAMYGNGLGGSSRRKNGLCAYLHNGVTIYEGHYMFCPNAGLKVDFGRYPEISILEHIKEKKERLRSKGKPLCITRGE